MSLESLPNELFHHIFDFLDAIEIFRAFDKLNSRFNTLIFTYYGDYRLNFSYRFGYQLENFCRRYLLSIIDRITSLRIASNNGATSSPTGLFFCSGLLLNQFIHLRSLSLCYIYAGGTLRSTVLDCHRLPHLTHLKVVEYYAGSLACVDFSNIIWTLPKLTQCRLQMETGCFKIPTVVSSSLEYLSISCKDWGFSEMVELLQQTPCLQRLHAPLNSLNDNHYSKLPSVPLMTTLKLSDVKSSHAMMNILLAMPNLVYLKVNTSFINCDGYRWEKIIDYHLPKLQGFHLKIQTEFVGKKNTEQHVDSLVESFRTPFWMEKHRWFIRCHYKSDKNCMDILLYTLPYAFGKFTLASFSKTYKTTSPQDSDHSLVAN